MTLKKFKIALGKINATRTEKEQALVYIYKKNKNLNPPENHFINNYLSNINKEVLIKVENLILKYDLQLNFELLVELFEILLDATEKKENGMVYTPKIIKDQIIQNTITEINVPTICDPACGCGSFIVSAATYLNEQYNISYSDIFQQYIFGIDIIEHNILKTKILCYLLAIENKELQEINFNLYNSNSLSFDWKSLFREKEIVGFDLVIGNPPYVRAKNMSEDVKNSLSTWETAQSGIPDLYIPFYELGLKILKPNGKLGYITVNTYFKSVNGRILRRYLLNEPLFIKILDFKDVQVFEGVTSYTCISLINKNSDLRTIQYGKVKDLNNIIFTNHSFDEFDKSGKGKWNFGNQRTLEIIAKLENSGKPLGEYTIRNGIATLKNDLYIFNPIYEDETFYYRIYKKKEYKIEKDACINIYKPNTMSNQTDIVDDIEQAIFPYNINLSGVEIIDEESFRKSYPNAYNFLLEHRELLLARDKGKGKYPTWYAYGRTQGMTVYGKKLLFPYMAGSPKAFISENVNELFYCGYAIFEDSDVTLKMLQKIMSSQLFWYYIVNTSKPYENGYYSTAKTYVANFTIPDFSESEIDELLRLDGDALEEFLCEKYEVNLEDIL